MNQKPSQIKNNELDFFYWMHLHHITMLKKNQYITYFTANYDNQVIIVSSVILFFYTSFKKLFPLPKMIVDSLVDYFHISYLHGDFISIVNIVTYRLHNKRSPGVPLQHSHT